jgi:glycosyltransferase involved in cell wall biosynthesis
VELLRLVPSTSMLCIGRGSDVFRNQFALAHPELAKRVHATGRISSTDVSAHLRTCDLLIQPFPDGISSRRTTTMAALANGVATVSNLGPLSEPFWLCDSLVVAPTPDPIEIAQRAANLLHDPANLATVGQRGAAFYRERFALELTISRLRGVGR